LKQEVVELRVKELLERYPKNHLSTDLEELVVLKEGNLPSYRALQWMLEMEKVLVVRQFRTAKDSDKLFKLQGSLGVLEDITERLERITELNNG